MAPMQENGIVNDEFSAIVHDFLGPGVDPREVLDVIAKSSPDAADLHVQGAAPARRVRRGNLHRVSRKAARKVLEEDIGKSRSNPVPGLFTRIFNPQAYNQAITTSAMHAANEMPKARAKVFGASLLGSAALGSGTTYAVMRKKRPKLVPREPVTKSDEYTWSGEISKVDDDKRQVFGYCSITHVNGDPVIDLQGDYIPLDEVEKAAYTYVLDSRKGGDMHARDGGSPLHVSDMIESFVVTPEKLESMGMQPDAVPHGWWVGFKVNDEKTWARVKSGERTGFSIHGSGRRVEKML